MRDYAQFGLGVMRIFTILLSFCSMEPQNVDFSCPKIAVRVLKKLLSKPGDPASVGCRPVKAMSQRQ